MLENINNDGIVVAVFERRKALMLQVEENEESHHFRPDKWSIK